jgi:glycosyltransferase involved in cell wall biosynthesis
MRRPRYAIIPTRNRPNILEQCVRAIGPQVDLIYIINNGDDALSGVDVADWGGVNAMVRDFEMQPPNLSLIWNLGLDHCAEDVRHTEWDVAILNDDAIVPEGWFDAVSNGMRAVSGAAGCSGPTGAVHTVPGPVPLHTRLVGYAFILAGELGLRANEDIHWFFSDDWMDWESRKMGGMVMVPGFQVNHLYPNGQVTPELQVQIAKDAQTFADIYGMRPW